MGCGVGEGGGVGDGWVAVAVNTVALVSTGGVTDVLAGLQPIRLMMRIKTITTQPGNWHVLQN
jgi:hypothetical protein